MAGYSGTPLVKKLGIREGSRVATVNAPDDFPELLGTLPDGATLQSGLRGGAPLDVIMVFVTRRAELEKQVPTVRKRMAPEAGFWVAWPKKASGIPSEVTENVVRDIALPTGLVDNKVCAIDDTWSGLRLVIRLVNR